MARVETNQLVFITSIAIRSVASRSRARCSGAAALVQDTVTVASANIPYPDIICNWERSEGYPLLNNCSVVTSSFYGKCATRTRTIARQQLNLKLKLYTPHTRPRTPSAKKGRSAPRDYL